MTRSRRIEGVDVARGVASLIMIQGHAYDGWASPDAKTTAAYAFTRVLGSLPLPAFLVLAGAAVALRVEAAVRRGESAEAVRRSLSKRGAMVVLYGYLTNAAYALMDGFDGPATFLRADVLHVIGLAIVALAWLGVRPSGEPSAPPDLGRLGAAAAGLALVPAVLCPWLSPLGALAPGPLRYALAPFLDVPGVTLMPFVPLASWLGIGALAAAAMRAARASSRAPIGPDATLAGAPTRWLWAAGAVAVALAYALHLATQSAVAELGVPLSRAEWTVWLNLVDLAARGAAVLAVSAALTPRLPGRVRALLVRVGRGSLLAYVFHVPFCYGRLGEAVRGRLTMTESTFAVAALMALSVGLVIARDLGRDALRRRRAA